jgi:hypothetical protein
VIAQIVNMALSWALCAILAAVMFKKGLTRTVPIFFIYAIYAVVVAAIRFAVMSHYALFAKIFWITEAGYLLLAFAAVWESFNATFRYFFVLGYVRFAVPAALAVAVSYAIWKAAVHPPKGAEPLMSVFIGIEIGAQYAIAATLPIFLVLAASLNKTYKRVHFGIVVGFAMAAAGMLFGTLFRSEFVNKFKHVSQFAPSVAYLFALCIWLASALTSLGADDKQNAECVSVSGADALSELQEYKHVLRRLQK